LIYLYKTAETGFITIKAPRNVQRFA
jgi:hypothetical protein